MAIRVKVKPAFVSVKVKSKNGGGIQATNPIVISSTFKEVIDRYDELVDVTEGTTPSNGAVGVYNSQNDKYEVKKLDFDDLVGDIDDVDGGTF